MKAHISGIQLGVADLDRAKQFYGEKLGWRIEIDRPFFVSFAAEDGSPAVGLYPRASLCGRRRRAGHHGRRLPVKDRVADVAELADAVRRVGRGGSAVDGEVVRRLLNVGRGGLEELTERERTILALMAEGR